MRKTALIIVVAVGASGCAIAGDAGQPQEAGPSKTDLGVSDDANAGAIQFASEAEAAAVRGEYPNADAYLSFAGRDRRAIRADQLGYLASSSKHALLVSESASPVPWTLHDADGRSVLRGRSRPLGMHEGSAEAVHRIDFSDATGEGGRFTLKAAGYGSSHSFLIGKDIYRSLIDDAFSYFYHNRAGMPVEARFAGGEAYARPAGHPDEVVTCFEGGDKNGVSWPGCDYSIDVTGGWYDAGDHGKYVVNSGISTWTLLNMKELGLSPVGDDPGRLPEGGNGTDDVLDEARYNIEFMLAMQAPAGATAAVTRGDWSAREAEMQPVMIDVSGMAHHKVADRHWTPLPTAPHEVEEDRLLYPPSTSATLSLAAVGAQCARLYAPVDADFAGRCLAAAERAFAAAKRVPDAYAYGNFDGSGPYGSVDPIRDFYWAAAELFTTTGKDLYADDLAEYSADLAEEPVPGDRQPSWGDTQLLGTISLALAAPKPEWRERATASIVATAEDYVEQYQEEFYLIPKSGSEWNWGSNGNLLNRGLVAAIAHDLTGNRRYLEPALGAMHYVLGRNPLAFSYVTGYGEDRAEAPHHRFWANEPEAGYPAPPPGVLVGGPVNTGRYGPVSEVVLDHCVGQTCYVDHRDAYEFNEVTINWNAPLLWLAAYLDERGA